MSHIHLPDGILPLWLWLSGYVVIIVYFFLLFLRSKKYILNKKLPLIGILAALMLVSMSIEIIPPVYHLNLAVLSGIVLGPVFSVSAILVVNIILAFVGHGGFTVIGLNTVIVSIEAILGYWGFKLLYSKIKKIFLCVFLATFTALFISSWSAIGIVYSGTHNFNAIFESHNHTKEHHELTMTELPESFDIKKFILFILAFGSAGWMIESIITAFIVNYIHKVRPDILENN